jgi:carbon monoxide dehydrogenase subunit G
MEVKFDKRYPFAAGVEPCWTVLADVRALAACMPGAQITEQVDAQRYKGNVRAKVGPALMVFGGEFTVQRVDAAARSLQLTAKGADRGGSSATMNMLARLEPGEDPGHAVLVGTATVAVAGKLAQFGNRLLVPVADAMLAQFADNFGAAAAAVAPPVAAGAAPAEAAPGAADAAPRELNAIALLWAAFKAWLARLFGRG